jgi:hypothetical protein
MSLGHHVVCSFVDVVKAVRRAPGGSEIGGIQLEIWVGRGSAAGAEKANWCGRCTPVRAEEAEGGLMLATVFFVGDPPLCPRPATGTCHNFPRCSGRRVTERTNGTWEQLCRNSSFRREEEKES